jgi:hypothetical protein
MRDKPIPITELPPSPDDERRSRMIKYSVAMGVRMVCIILCLFVPGWWLLVPALGAIVLPYFAVLIANTATRSTATVVERPGGIVQVRSTRRPTASTGAAPAASDDGGPAEDAA